MVEPLQILWLAFIVFLALILLVLLEIHRINYRRANEVMYGTDSFDEKVATIGFSDKEKRTLDKIIRESSFENKDAILNSSGLFEAAVSNFYKMRYVFDVRDETLAAVERLRNKLDFMARNPLAEIFSTRQFNVGDRVDLLLDEGKAMVHSSILRRNEKEWTVAYDASVGQPISFVSKEIRIRWTRPDDAIYSTSVAVHNADHEGNLLLLHSSSLDKRQLRRWVREQVVFPVTAHLENGSSCEGALLDLSAGGIMLGLPVECYPGQHLRIQFELPSFGDEDVEIEILRNLGYKNKDFPSYFCLTASFSGAFGWTQERVLQYLFELSKAKKGVVRETKKA